MRPNSGTRISVIFISRLAVDHFKELLPTLALCYIKLAYCLTTSAGVFKTGGSALKLFQISNFKIKEVEYSCIIIKSS